MPGPAPACPAPAVPTDLRRDMTTTATPRPAQGPGAALPPEGAIDPRGPQLAAALTAVVLVAVLLLPTLVRPRLAPPTEWEAPEPPRFAQAVGLAFALVGLLAFAAGATVVAQVAVGLALVAALLNAVFAFCLGCEVYLLVRRFIATV